MSEAIYIAGPECFYIDGNARLNAMRRIAEARGHSATLPNDTPLKLDNEDLRINADIIFENCAQSMNASTAIICDLEFYRGAEPDGGSIYEIGMAYARGIKCYAYTRDKRNMCWKYQGLRLLEGKPYDLKGRALPYAELPFSPNVIGSTKIVEGDFSSALTALENDAEEERKFSAHPGYKSWKPEFVKRPLSTDGRPVLYIAGPQRYESGAEAFYAQLKALAEGKGFVAITPMDDMPEHLPGEDAYTAAYRQFLVNCQHVVDCDIILADLNDFHGWEPESDTSFECGFAFQLGKKLYAHVDDTTRMRDRVPSKGESFDWRDACGCNVENFDYPLNLMFSSSMEILRAKAGEAIEKLAQFYGK